MSAEIFQPQLLAVRAELDAAEESAKSLAASSDEPHFLARPEPERWSAAENIIHLSLTTEAMLPLLVAMLEDDSNPRIGPGHVFRRDILGAFLGWSLEPPHRYRMKTTAPFTPHGGKTRREIIEEFSKLQDDLRGVVADAQTHDLAKMRIVSPFDARVTYNLYSALKIIPAHQRRHLWQAQNAMQAVL